MGLFGKSLIDDPSGGGMYSDVVLFAFISVLILVGTFATEVATSTWEEIQTENVSRSIVTLSHTFISPNLSTSYHSSIRKKKSEKNKRQTLSYGVTRVHQ